MPMRIEVSFDGTNVERLPLHIEGNQAPDVIRLSGGTLYVLVGKPLDGREAHYRYRRAKIHDAAFIGEVG